MSAQDDKSRRAYLAAYMVTRQGGRAVCATDATTEESEACARGIHDGIKGNPPTPEAPDATTTLKRIEMWWNDNHDHREIHEVVADLRREFGGAA